ncbi:MAG: hypothetical protein WCD43_04440 [Candidatus Acidiferrales bacterium]
MDSYLGQTVQTQEELRAWLQTMTDAKLVEFGRAGASSVPEYIDNQ